MSDVHDFTTKFNGEGYVFTVFVNTNEDPREIGARLQKAARGQIKAACMVGVAALTPEETRERMEALAKIAASGAGKEVDIDWHPSR